MLALCAMTQRAGIVAAVSTRGRGGAGEADKRYTIPTESMAGSALIFFLWGVTVPYRPPLNS